MVAGNFWIVMIDTLVYTLHPKVVIILHPLSLKNKKME
jgi:hypothetical protein